jgi:lysophospholipase L1-like esterase
MTKYTFIAAIGLAGLVAPVGVAHGAQPDQFPLRDGDRIVFYGDSITQDGGYCRMVEAYVRTRFPEWDLRFFNAGVGGDRVDGGGAGDIATRLERDVVPLRPTVVTIMLGMNDGGYRKLEPATREHFAAGYRSIVARLLREVPGMRLYLILPSPFDDISRPPQFDPGYDRVLRELGGSIAAIAQENHAQTVDFGGPLNAAIARVAQRNPELARTLLPDRVHPSPAGHLVLGAALLRAWHAPSLVTRVAIDAQALSAQAENTAVSDVSAAGGKLEWRQLDRALPLPLNFQDAGVELASGAQADLEALDQEPLRVTGLAEGSYELRIDGSVVGTFSRSELEAGVNLALYGTPMRAQAFPVAWGAEGSHQAQLVRRDMMAHGQKTPAMAQATETLASYDEGNQIDRSRSAVPKAHAFSLARLP